MISLYSGLSDSGLITNLGRKILNYLLVAKKNVIANFRIDMDLITKKGKRKASEFVYLTNHEITVEFLKEYSLRNHIRGADSQTVLIINKVELLLSDNCYRNSEQCKSLVNFFVTCKYYGYDIILVAENDSYICKNMREIIGLDFKHKKINKFLPLFVVKIYWAGINEINNLEYFFRCRKYDSLFCVRL